MPSSAEQAHQRIYDQHADLLAAALLVVLKRLDLDELATYLVQQAAIQAGAGSDPVTRRRVVSGIAYAAIAGHVHAADRQILDGRNADAWTHATAYGAGEAHSTPPDGGSPDRAKIAAGATIALGLISNGEATSATAGWTDQELRSLAMGAALAAGDGAAFDTAVRNVTSALTDQGTGLDQATRTYGDLLHTSMSESFVQTVQAKNPLAAFRWVAQADACPACEDLASESPYAADALPDYPPEHPNCRCYYEQAGIPVGVS